MRAKPRAQQRPKALDRVDVDLAEAVAILVAGVFTAPVADALVAIAQAFQAGVDAILVGVDQGARATAPVMIGSIVFCRTLASMCRTT